MIIIGASKVSRNGKRLVVNIVGIWIAHLLITHHHGLLIIQIAYLFLIVLGKADLICKWLPSVVVYSAIDLFLNDLVPIHILSLHHF